MAKNKSTAARALKLAPKVEALGPGLHGGTIERIGADGIVVRTLDRRRWVASLAPGVEPELADECLRAARMVILCEGPAGAMIAGALQTARSVMREADGSVLITGKEVRLRAERWVTLEVGASALRLDREGAMRAEGHRMVIDMGANVRVLSALVELP